MATGGQADFVLLDAANPVEAIRLRAPRRLVLRRGVVLAEAPPAAARLNLPGRPARVDFRLQRPAQADARIGV
jgi:cytosine deaminase